MRDNSKDKPEECDCCSFETEALKAYEQHRYFGSRPAPTDASTYKWLCSLCAGTMAGSGAEYPEQYHTGKDLEILQAICYVGNAIIEEIRKGRTHGAKSGGENMAEYQDVLDGLDSDLANVDKSELADWAVDNYEVIRAALEMAAATK